MEEATEVWRLFFEINRVKETASSNENSSNIEEQKLGTVEKEMNITNNQWMNNNVIGTFDILNYCYIGCIIIAFVIGMLIGKQLY